MESGMKDGNDYQPYKSKISYEGYNKQPYAKKYDIDKMDKFLKKTQTTGLTQEKNENLD